MKPTPKRPSANTMRRRLRPNPLWPALLGAALILALGARPAGALVGSIELIAGVEMASVNFDQLADFTRYRITRDGSPEEPESVIYRLDDDSVVGFRVGVRLHRQLDLVWTRLQARSRYFVEVDGTVVPDGTSGTQFPGVDVRFDTISLGYRPEIGRWGVHPLLRLGYGWVLLSQDDLFAAPRRLPTDLSDSDKTMEISAELNGRWGVVEAGAGLRAYFWRWDAEDEFIPARNTRALTWSFHVGVGL